MKPQIDLTQDGLFKFAIGTLWFCGVIYLLLGIGFGATYVFLGAIVPNSGPEALIFILTGVAVFGVSIVIGVGNFAAAWGLSKRKKWAWIVCIIIGALYAPSGCMPLGVLLLIAMLRNGVKESYEAAAHAAAGGPTQF